MKKYAKLYNSFNIDEYDKALEWLYNQKKSKKKEDLVRITRCIELLNIKADYDIIHIAGTNGKGSTASYLNEMLKLKYNRVGLFVSPYVICFNERIEINSKYISNSEVLFYINYLKKFAEEYYESYNDTVSFFELTFLMALLYFEKNNIDILVLECGLGGLLDVTNALNKKVSAITNIGYDHMQQLGNTLEEIALHKLGITRKNVPCFTAVDKSLIPFFEEYSFKNNININYVIKDIEAIYIKDNKTHFKYKNEEYQASLEGNYQAYNASLAIAVMKYLDNNYPKKLIDQALNNTFWPGRFEHISDNIIIDGAHNIDGIKALCNSLKNYQNKKIKVIFTALRDKEIKSMLTLLDEVASFYYFTTIDDKRAVNTNDFIGLTKNPFILFDNYKEALNEAQRILKDDELLVITGSLHFISVIRKILV